MNAIPAAEMALAQILLSCRGYFHSIRDYCESHDHGRAKAFHRSGVNGETIGLIGMGMIGKRLSALVQGFSFRVIANDRSLVRSKRRSLAWRSFHWKNSFGGPIS